MVEGNKDELLVYKIFLQKELTLHFRPRQIGGATSKQGPIPCLGPSLPR